MGAMIAMLYIDAITYRFGAFIDIFTPEHTGNEDDEVTGKFYISR